MTRRLSFEAVVLQAVLAGAAGGLLRSIVATIGPSLSLSFSTILAVCVAAARGDRFDRWLIRILALAGAAVCGALPIDLAELAGGAMAGALLLWSSRCAVGPSAGAGRRQLGALNYLAGAALGAGLCWMGSAVASALGARGLLAGVPGPLVAVFGGAVLALFLGLSTVAGKVALRINPVEARADQVLPLLRGELDGLARRALFAYRDCARCLRGLPPEPERDELAVTVSRMTEELLDLSAQWADVDREIDTRTDEAHAEDQRQLADTAARATDPIARAHLALALTTLKEDETQRRGLEQQRERIVARLWLQLALLERARASLVGARSGHAQLRAAELAGLSRRLSALSRSQELEGRLASEVAVKSDLTAIGA